jgi:hypothetical protein
MKQSSKDGYEFIKPQIGPVVRAIIEAMKSLKGIEYKTDKGVFTADYCGNRYQISKSVPFIYHETVGKRLSEMVRDGILEEIGINKGVHGINITVFQLTNNYR